MKPLDTIKTVLPDRAKAFSERVKSVQINPKITIEALSCALLGMLTAAASVLNRDAVLTAPMVAAMSPACGLSCIFGAMLSAIFTQMTASRTAGLAASAVVFLTRIWFGSGKRSDRRYPYAATAASFVSYLGCGLFADSLAPSGIYTYVNTAVVAAISGACTYFLAFVTRRIKPQAKLADAVSQIGVGELAPVCSLAVCIASSFAAFGVSAGDILLILVAEMFLQRLGKGSAIFTAVCFLGQIAGTGHVGAEGAVVVAAAVLYPQRLKISAKRLWTAVYVAVAVLIVTAISVEGEMVAIISSAVEIIVASAAFMLIPDRVLELISSERTSAETVSASEMRTEFLVSALKSLNFGDGGLEISDMASEVCSRVCISCDGYVKCFESGDGRAEDALKRLERDTEHEIDMPFCGKRSEIGETMKLLRYKYESDRLREQRKRGFLTAERVIFAAVGETSCPCGTDSGDVCDTFRSILSRTGGLDAEAKIGVMKYGDGSAEVYLPKDSRISSKTVLDAAEKAGFGSGAEVFRSETDKLVRYSISPKPLWHIETGVCQAAGNCAKSGDIELIDADVSECGDYALLWNRGVYSFAALSDGMGSGSEAREAAKLLADTFKSLTDAGYSHESALALSAEYLRCRMPSEIFATLDFFCANLLTGEAKIIKCGAERSYILSENVLAPTASGGYPIGIMDEPKYLRVEIPRADSVTILMLTDGAQRIGLEKLTEIAQLSSDLGTEELAAEVVKRAIISSGDGKRDDMTAAVIKLTKN